MFGPYDEVLSDFQERIEELDSLLDFTLSELNPIKDRTRRKLLDIHRTIVRAFKKETHILLKNETESDDE